MGHKSHGAGAGLGGAIIGHRAGSRRLGFFDFSRHHLIWTLANFRCSETAALQVFPMPAGIFARSRARPGPTKNSVYPYILGHFAHPPLRKLAKVQLRYCAIAFCRTWIMA